MKIKVNEVNPLKLPFLPLNVLNFLKFPRFTLYYRKDDKEAFEFYLDKFRNPNNPIYPAPQGLEDMAYLQKILLDKNPNNNENTNQ